MNNLWQILESNYEMVDYKKNEVTEEALIRMNDEADVYDYETDLPDVAEICKVLLKFYLINRFTKDWLDIFCMPSQEPVLETTKRLTGVEFFTSSLSIGTHLNVSVYKDNWSLDFLKKDLCDFSLSCQYGSMSTEWHLLNEEPDHFRWMLATRSRRMPTWPAVGFYSHHTSTATMISNIIPCLKPDSYFTFKMWLSRASSVKVCLLNVVTGLLNWCSKIYTQNKLFYYKHLYIPILNSDSQQQMIVFYGVVSRGFIILDDLGYSGKKCDTKNSPELVINHENWTNLGVNWFIRNQLMHLLIKNLTHFTSYLETRLQHYESDKNHEIYRYHVCKTIPCSFKDGWCNYKLSHGTVPFKLRRHLAHSRQGNSAIWTQKVPTVYFPIGLISFAILTSPVFEPVDDNKTIKITLDTAMLSRPCFVCFYTHQYSTGQCRAIESLVPVDEYEWVEKNLKIPYGATQFQVVSVQNEPKSTGPNKGVILNIGVVGC